MLWFVGRDLVAQWRAYANAPIKIHFHWIHILASGAVVLATYALLIELWRRILAEWRATIRFGDAVRIWCVSNLGKYVPGKVWQILAMGRLARRVDVPAAAAAGSAILNTVVNIAVGFVVAVVAGFRGLNALTRGNATLSIGITIAAICAVLLLPMVTPRLTALAERTTGRTFDMGELPARAVYLAIVGNTIAWLLYGFAFELLVYGVLGRAPGPWTGYVAVYALSYVIGYLVFFTPGGVGTREVVQTTGLATLGLANPKEAAIIAIVSRLWLTVLEVLPGVFYLAREARRRPTSHDPNGSNI